MNQELKVLYNLKKNEEGGSGGCLGVDVHQQPSQVKRALKIVRYCTMKTTGAEQHGGRRGGGKM